MVNKLTISSFHFFILLFTLILLTSCQSNYQQSTLHSLSKKNTSQIQKENPQSSFYSDFLLPISIPKGEFSRVIGWLNNDEIVYMTQFPEGSNLYRHDLTSGKSKILYESEHPIITARLNPDRNRILIHSAPTTFEGKMTIIDTDGEDEFSHSFPSVDMVFEWNQYNSEQLFITAFKEDWSFSNYYLNLSKKELKPIDVRKPFAKWTGKSKLAFLDWSDQDISLFSPLIQKEFGKEEFQLQDEIFQFDTFFNKILTITVDPVEQLAKYSFYSEDMVERYSFKVPVLSSYSGWLIPNYELSADQAQFLTMIPLGSAEADTYRDGYQMISVELATGKQDLILEDTDNVPFTCSPNKQYCLMGYQFEKLLNLENKMIIPLF